MTNAQQYIATYKEPDRSKVAFAWNGKHRAEFLDAIQEFRWEVVRHCIEHPEQPSPDLLVALFRADADWSRETWLGYDAG